MVEERLQFQAEVGRLLDIVARSLYSKKEVFLRELVSNASDACDRLRYAALTEPGLLADDPVLKVRISIDKDARTLAVADNGIGMNRDELIQNLGTIARSGTRAFLDSLAQNGEGKGDDVSLIGQFGVGFYSAFMVAREVEVLTRKAGDAEGWRWTSDGRGDFAIAPAEGLPRGTRILLHLSEGEDEFLEDWRLKSIIKTYSDHLALPIVLVDKEGKEETLNRASALWTRPKSEVTPEQYREFYHHVAHAYDDPWLTLHYKAEGRLDYSALLFVPATQPFDLFHPERKAHVKLYVRRVFVTDQVEGLVPPYLRFLRGVVDSDDLPLNISREMLQGNPVIARIRQGLVKRVLAELGRKAGEDAEGYAAFWEHFGAVLKEGIYEDHENRETLAGLIRARSTAAEGLVSLDDYVGRMKEGQEAIYTITGDDAGALARSPQIEGFRARGVEVLLLTDPVDEFWTTSLGRWKDKPFVSVTRADADLSKIKAPEAEAAAEKPIAEGIEPLLARLRDILKDEVKDVRPSTRLTDSAVCLVAGDGDLDMHLERLLKQHRQVTETAKRILEINPRHSLTAALAALAARPGSDAQLSDAAWLLLDQARIIEGAAIPDPGAFARRLAGALERGLA